MPCPFQIKGQFNNVTLFGLPCTVSFTCIHIPSQFERVSSGQESFLKQCICSSLKCHKSCTLFTLTLKELKHTGPNPSQLSSADEALPMGHVTSWSGQSCKGTKCKERKWLNFCWFPKHIWLNICWEPKAPQGQRTLFFFYCGAALTMENWTGLDLHSEF